MPKLLNHSCLLVAGYINACNMHDAHHGKRFAKCRSCLSSRCHRRSLEGHNPCIQVLYLEKFLTQRMHRVPKAWPMPVPPTYALVIHKRPEAAKLTSLALFAIFSHCLLGAPSSHPITTPRFQSLRTKSYSVQNDPRNDHVPQPKKSSFIGWLCTFWLLGCTEMVRDYVWGCIAQAKGEVPPLQRLPPF